MNLIKLLLKLSWLKIIIIIISGVISGVCSVSLISLLSSVLEQSQTSSSSLAWQFIALCSLRIITNFINKVASVHLSQGVTCHLERLLSQRIGASSLYQLETIGASKLLASLTRDVRSIASLISSIPSACINFTIVIYCMGYLGWLSGNLFLLLIFFVCLTVTVTFLLHKRAIAELKIARQLHDQLFRNYSTLTQGIKELKLHSDRLHVFLNEELKYTTGAAKKHKIIGSTIYAGMKSWSSFLSLVFLGILLFVLPSLKPISSSFLIKYVFTFLYMTPYIKSIINQLSIIDTAKVAFKKLSDLGLLLDNSMESNIINLQTSKSSCCELEIRDVTYTYFQEAEDSQFTLGPLNFSLNTGEIIFIVGGNGSGKSTLVKCLTGLYIPNSGEIRLDEHLIDDSNREWFRQHFSVVFTDFYLFEKFYGVAQTQDKIDKYLHKLQLQHKVKVEDLKLSTIKLSQGQRKRLALLTALLEDRPICVFDEWAAEQDPIFKGFFYNELLPELKSQGKTVVVISHDEKFFSIADRILKLEYGLIETEA